MSLRRNLLANYISQICITAIGIVTVPMYIRYMGAEAYGLVGFYAMLQAAFMILDLGLTPTMARETARYRGGAIDALELRRLLRSIEGLFILVGVTCMLAAIASAEFISTTWLNVKELRFADVYIALILMVISIALRWLSGLYRGAISGFERIVWLSAFNTVIAILRYVLVIPILIIFDAGPIQFFSYQLVIALIELLVLIAQVYRCMPEAKNSAQVHWGFQPLKRIANFSLSIMFTTCIGILIMQVDRLMLSKILSLELYGYFTLAVLVAAGVFQISSPITAVIIPRLSKLVAEGDSQGVLGLYRAATQVVATVAVPAASVLAFFSDEVLWIWVGDKNIVSYSSSLLALYAVGYGLMALAAFPAHLQVAKGHLRLHVIGNCLFILFLVPLLLYLVQLFGVLGAGYAWLIVNSLYFFFWIPVVHHKFIIGSHFAWLFKDIGSIALPVVFTVGVIQSLVIWPVERLAAALLLGAIILGALSVSVLSSRLGRAQLKIFTRKSLKAA